MQNNGVSHKTDSRDLDGVYTVLKWLSYMPKVSEATIFTLYREREKKGLMIRRIANF